MRDRKRIVVIVFSTFVILMAAGGFLYKVTEFVETIVKDELHGFGVSAIVTYLIGMTGLLFMTIWGFLKGYFRDIERPKHRMLEMESDYDRIEQATGHGPKAAAVSGKEG